MKSSMPRPASPSPLLAFLVGAVCVMALLLVGSCSSDLGSRSCSDDVECEGGWCEQGICADGVRPASTNDQGAALESGMSGEATSEAGSTQAPPSSSLGDYLDSCVRNEDCRSGICISSPIGRVCTKPCTLDQECAPAAGWRCQLIQGDRDLVRVCYPDATDLCEPCEVDTDCGGLNDLCVEVENGTYCGLDCRFGGVCPEGYYCVESIDKDWSQCFPNENRCGDCRDADLMTDPFNCGDCDVECAFDFGSADCVGGECVLVDCDPGRANCDGREETGCETDIESDLLHCGACDAPCPTDGGPVRCEEGECIFEGCPTGERLCDGACRPANACGGCDDLGATPGEDTCGACNTGLWQCSADSPGTLTCVGASDPLTDSMNCGEECLTCTGGRICQQGACACPEGQLLCEGTCRAPNACGGCGDLSVTPGEDACGACDTGTWQCDEASPGAVTCVGATDPLTDSMNCGDSCLACTGGQVCSNGACGCPDGQLLCEGTCRAPNACGGCGALALTPGEDACGACDTGTWQCDETNPGAVTCIGATDPLTDSQNCGDACLTCAGGQTCRGGVCACPDGQINCEGSCRAPNACGGCGDLSVTPGEDACGACDTGTWQCDAANPGAVTCTGATNPLTDSQNCGDACLTCTGGRTCQAGVCACPTGQILCEGSCRAPNACGGCGDLAATPGVDTCGACDTGTWQCVDGNPNALTCVGATDPLSDDLNCGASCQTCTGGRTCQAGLCACPTGQILCGDTCTVPNACGGCSTLAATPGVDACGACNTGVWQCTADNPNTLTCEGATDPLTDNQNCGASCQTCTGGQSCQGGVCTCPSGQILCEGSCQAPNACGGCGVLAATPDVDSCGLCDNGTWRCDSANPGTLTCVGATVDVCTGGCDELERSLFDTCEDCGTWVCGSQTWQCLLPDFNVSDTHCGGCFNTCSTNETCDKGVCVPGPLPIGNVWIRNVGIWYEELEGYLTDTRGYSVTRSNTLNAAVLNNHELIFVDMFAARDASVSPQEIEDWVREGGMLVIVGYTGRLTVGGDGTPADDPQRCAMLNPLMDRFGMRFSNVGNTTSPCSGGNFNSINVFPTTFGSHPIVRDPDLTQSNITPRSGWRIRTLDSDISEGIAWIRTDDTVLHVAEVGNGRVVALADGGVARNMRRINLNHEIFWNEAIDWLRFAQ